MKRKELFTNFLFNLGGKETMDMPKEIADIYTAAGISLPRRKMSSFAPMRKTLEEVREGMWQYATKGGLLILEREGKEYDTIVTYDGIDIYAAKVDKAGKFAHYADLKTEARFRGKSTGTPLMVAFYYYANKVLSEEKAVSFSEKAVNKILEKMAYTIGIGSHPEYMIVWSDMAYRLFDKAYSFGNMTGTRYPFLKKKEYLKMINDEEVDISNLEITKKLQGKKGAPKKVSDEEFADEEKAVAPEKRAVPKKFADEEKEAETSETPQEMVEKVIGKTNPVLEEVKKLKDQFGLKATLSKEDLAEVPAWDEKWSVTKTLTDALKSVRFVGNNLLLYGPAGTGKSTLAKQVACILGLPYSFFTCSEKTDESNLLVSIIPNGKDSAEQSRFKAALSQLDLIKLDAPSWMQIVTGVYNPKVTEEACYSFINSFDATSSKFDFVESELVRGIRRPSVVEIQEPTVISKPGVLVALNSLLDDNEEIKIATGEMVKRHPQSVIILTTNVSYNGCRSMNQSVLSRMDGVIALSDISREELIKRATLVCSIKKPADIKIVEQMADYFLKIREYLKENGICDDAGGDGIIDPRGFVSWVKAYLFSDMSLRESVALTIIDRTSLMDSEERQQTWDSCIKPLIPA